MSGEHEPERRPVTATFAFLATRRVSKGCTLVTSNQPRRENAVMRKMPIQVLLVLGALAAGCGGAVPGGCTPGQVVSCPCRGGGSGVQGCLTGGTFGSCDCDGLDGSTTTDATTDRTSQPPPDAGPNNPCGNATSCTSCLALPNCAWCSSSRCISREISGGSCAPPPSEVCSGWICGNPTNCGFTPIGDAGTVADNGGPSEPSCAPASSCLCDPREATAVCNRTCTGRGCEFECTGMGACNFACPAGGCHVSASVGRSGTGPLTLSCAGGGCSIDCVSQSSCRITECSSGCSCTDGGRNICL